jgi:hypothetical protein
MYRIFFLTSACLSLGCGGAKSPNYASLGLVEVSGKVTLDGTPLPNASVAFENPDDKTFSVGKTDDAGVYKLMFNSDKSGCTPGKKIVRITPYMGSESDAETPPSDAKIPAKYGRNSELSAEVDSSKRSFDFALTSK